MNERENLHSKPDKGVTRLWLVDLNHNFECDWLIELFDNKLSDNRLSDNNLASELVKNRSFKTIYNQGNCDFYDKLNYTCSFIGS